MTDEQKLVLGVVDVAIINNGSQARLSATKDAARGFFRDEPDAVRDVHVVEWQALANSLSRWARVQRTFLILCFELQNAFFLGTSPLALAKIFARNSLEIGRCLSGPKGKQATRSFAELALTDKHIRCLNDFVEGNADYLLVLEDDVSLAKGVNLSGGLLLKLLDSSKTSPLFVSLAKAFTLKELGLEGKVEKRDDHLFHLRKGATNTTAAYLANRLFVEKALAQILNRPHIRRLPSDWMISSLIRQTIGIDCLHAQEGPFVNGSLLGLTKSEIRP